MYLQLGNGLAASVSSELVLEADATPMPTSPSIIVPALPKLWINGQGKTDWSTEILAHEDVKTGHIKLRPCGLFVDCNDCGTSHKMRRPFELWNWHAHEKLAKHIARKAARVNTMLRIRKGIEK